MFLSLFSKKSYGLYIFIFLVLLIVFLQFFLLKPVIGQGLNHDDYEGVLNGILRRRDFFLNPIDSWLKLGPHFAYTIFFASFLELIFKSDFKNWLIFTIILKILATLSLYPLTLILFKNRLLAFLATVIFSISSSSAGPLYYYINGIEYLGIFFINLFFISYYYTIRNNKLLLLLVTSFLLLLSFLTATVRIYPIFLLIIVLEIFILLKNSGNSILNTLVRTLLLFLPVSIIVIASWKVIMRDGVSNNEGIMHFFKLIADGNWFLLLNPIGGLGYSVLPSYNPNFFGRIDLSSFSGYIQSIIWPSIFFYFLSLALSFILAEKVIRFLLILICSNFILDVLVFLLATHHVSVSSLLIPDYNQYILTNLVNAAILAVFIVSFSFTAGFTWFLTGRKNLLLLIIFLSPFFSLLLISGIWLFTREMFMYQGGMHRYLTIPAIGISILFASILVAFYQRREGVGFRVFIASIIVILIFAYFEISRNDIAQTFDYKKNTGTDLQTQISMQNKILKDIPLQKLGNNLLLFILPSNVQNNSYFRNPFEAAFDIENIITWMFLRRGDLLNDDIKGCIAVISEKEELGKLAVINNGMKGFLFKAGSNRRASCVNAMNYPSGDGVFYDLDNFYAFKLEGSEVTNITEEIINNLSF